MQSSSLQTLLTMNADRITNINIQIGFQADQAQNYKNKGENDKMKTAYIKLHRARRDLAKATELQVEMKTELLAIHRAARIVAKTAKLLKHGVTFVASQFATSIEIEHDLDKMIHLRVPKKPDSRFQQAA